MKTDSPSSCHWALPGNRVAVAIHDDPSPLKLCVILQKQASGIEPIVLRQLNECQVLLGCVIDAATTIHEVIEIWVQRLVGSGGILASVRTGVDNHSFDRRWTRFAAAWKQFLPQDVIALANEIGPLWIDSITFRPWKPVTAEQVPYRLCTDETLLSEAKLPPYSTTLNRFLVAGTSGSASFIRLDDAPAEPDAAVAFAKTFPSPSLLPINPEGTPVLIRKYHAHSLENWANFLTGVSFEESLGRDPSPLSTGRPLPADTKSESKSDERPFWMFPGQSGSASRIVESLFLRLTLLHQAVDAVRTHVKSTQSPMLSITASSFRIQTADAPSPLPVLWTGCLKLVDPGDAAEVKVPGVESRYFLPLGTTNTPYRAITSSRHLEGRANLRLREVSQIGEEVSIEGTLSTQDRVRVDKNDLLRLRVGIGRVRAELWAKLEEGSSLVAGEWRVRTLPQKLPSNVVERFQEFQGQVLAEVPFELLQSMSTPCDVYSLAILAMRLLLVNSRRTLPIVIDDFVALVTELRSRDTKMPLTDRIDVVFKSDPRWMEVLGPANLSFEPDARNGSAIPLTFWREVIAAIVKMIPGQLPESHLADFGDAPEGAVHRVFDAPHHEFRTLMTQSQSLLTLDWRANREIDSILRSEQNLPVGQASAFSNTSPVAPAKEPAPFASTSQATGSQLPGQTRPQPPRPRDAVVIQRGNVQDRQ